MFLVLYGLLLVLFLYLLNRKIQEGPEELEDVETVPMSEPARHVPRRLQPAPARGRPGGRAMTLNDVWFVLFILIIAGYLILDGFDMGVGILLLPLARTDAERRTFLNSIGPVWDGNEVWLVLGGGVLFAVFPLAYASLFSGLYLAFMPGPAGHHPADGRARVPLEGAGPALAIDLGHRLRGGVARVWRSCSASRSATSCAGLPVDANGNISIGLIALLTPFALLVGVTTVAMFAVQGGHLPADQDRGRRCTTGSNGRCRG